MKESQVVRLHNIILSLRLKFTVHSQPPPLLAVTAVALVAYNDRVK
jgi:hypothetical protein